MLEKAEKSAVYGPSSDLARMAKNIRQSNRARKNKLVLVKSEPKEMYDIDLDVNLIDHYSSSSFRKANKCDNHKPLNYNKINRVNSKVCLKSYSFNDRNLVELRNIVDANSKSEPMNNRLAAISNNIRYKSGSNQQDFSSMPSSNKHEKYKKFLWANFLIISTFLCGYMIVKTLIDYCGYEVITKIRVFNEKVTIYDMLSYDLK
jgi:hypothetical protein